MARPVRLPALSTRLDAVARLVKPCQRVFDIGTDHAFLPIELVRRGICPRATASDIGPGPIEVARKNICRAGLEQVIDTVVTNGLQGHAVGPDDAIVLSGLGGLEMIDILAELKGPCGQVILQPQKSAMELRFWLDDHGYQIADEDLVFDRERIYVILRAVPADTLTDTQRQPALTLLQAVIGPVLLVKNHPLHRAYLEQIARHLRVACRRMPELSRVLQNIQDSLAQQPATASQEGGEA